MIDLSTALAIANSVVAGLETKSRIAMAIDEAATEDRGWCWVFYYNSREFLERGNEHYLLAGNGPIVVYKDGGAVRRLGTARPVDVQLAELQSESAGNTSRATCRVRETKP